MSVTPDQLNDFHQFALGRLTSGEAASIPALAHQWQVARERDEVNAALAEAMEDIQAGRYRPAEDVSRDLRKKFNLPE
jgi:predicted transcriptional regulator